MQECYDCSGLISQFRIAIVSSCEKDEGFLVIVIN